METSEPYFENKNMENKGMNKTLILAIFLLAIIPLASSTSLDISSPGESHPLDSFRIEIRDDSILKNVTINYCFYDSDKDECIFEGTEFVPRIDEEYEWEVRIDKNLFELETKEYQIKSTINGTRNGEYFEVSNSEWNGRIKMLIEDDLAVIKNLTETSENWDSYSVGENIPFNSEIWNVGNNNQTAVYIKVYSDDLNLNELINLGEINSMDKKDFNYTLNIPEDMDFFGEEYLCPKVFFTLYNSSLGKFNKSNGEFIEERREFCVKNPIYRWNNNNILDSNNKLYPLDSFRVNFYHPATNVTLWYGLYDSDKEIYIFNGTEQIPAIGFNGGDSKEIRIDKSLFQLENKNYLLQVKINGTKVNGDIYNDSAEKWIQMIIDNDLVVLNNLTETSENWWGYSVGDNLTFKGEVWNIGKNNQTNVYMKVHSYDLGDEWVSIGNISSMSEVNFSYTKEIPTNLNFGGVHDFYSQISFDLYKDQTTQYIRSDGQLSEEEQNFKIQDGFYGNNNNVNEPSAKIDYNIIGKPEIGKESTIKFNITNNGNIPINGKIDLDYNYNDHGEYFTDWATFLNFSSLNINLDPNQSMETILKITPKLYGLHYLKVNLYNNTSEEQINSEGAIIFVENPATSQTTIIDNALDQTNEINSLNQKIKNLQNDIHDLEDNPSQGDINALEQKLQELQDLVQLLKNQGDTKNTTNEQGENLINLDSEKTSNSGITGGVIGFANSPSKVLGLSTFGLIIMLGCLFLVKARRSNKQLKLNLD